MGTDMAFAVGVLSLVGRGVPPALRLLLLTLAIIDDIAAVVAIALYYSSRIAAGGLSIAAAGVLREHLPQWLGRHPPLPCRPPATAACFGRLRRAGQPPPA